MRTIATAGHVDHGKSSLVLALTGTDPDRFPEEKQRGLTIDLGFAFTKLPSGEEVGFVDVPGHVRFIKNMLAGVGAVDVVMLVVAANEGWMPQSEEHLGIIELLGVRHGLVCLTKADLVDEDTLELARLELDERLAGSALGDAPVVVCDAVSGRGLDDVRAGLDAVLAAAPAPVDHGRPRLWVDRVFAAKGAGTVVTGTLAGGSLRVDDEVEVGPRARRARIRAIETAHHQLDMASPGTRVALNLAGPAMERRAVRRGDGVVRAGQWQLTDVVDVGLEPLGDNSFRGRASLQCYVGSGEHAAALRVLDTAGRYGRLRLDGRVPLAPGDRLVLRDPGERDTIGGAEVLDAAPSGRARDAAASLALPLERRLLAGHRWLGVDALGPRAGLGAAEAAALADDLVRSGAAVRVDGWLVAPDTLTALRSATSDQVRAHHARAPLEPGVDLATLASELGVDADRLRAALADEGELVVERGYVRDATRRSGVGESAEARALLDALEKAPFSPPEPASAGTDPALVRSLVREGAVVDLEGVVFASSAVDEARRRVRAALRDRGTVTVADVRDLLGSTRKYVLPILKQLDAEGVTRRRGDDRIPGPAALRDA
ncbi:MAG TPA: selenocysteine-specific translation elongation factor [Acidimicrobiia bacterium]|nr:selenocysteine-specific translation elongation factor [Acidimicrobiia bacterium]